MIKKLIKWPIFISIICFLFLNLVFLNLVADTGTEERQLSIDRIFASAEFSARNLNQVTWLPDSSGYLTLEDNKSLIFWVIPVGIPPHLRNLFHISTL